MNTNIKTICTFWLLLLSNAILLAQPKAYLTSVETSKLFEVSGGMVATNPAENENMDFTFISNRIEEFLRTDYLKDFPINLANKEDLMANESYTSFESPVIARMQIKNYKNEPLGDGSYQRGYSIADGYSPNNPLGGDLADLKEIFPDGDIFITATVSFFAMQSSTASTAAAAQDNDQRMVPKLTLTALSKNNKFKILTITTWYDVPKADEVVIFGLEYDLDKQNEIFSAMTDKLIERMKTTKEKKLKQYNKWSEKNFK